MRNLQFLRKTFGWASGLKINMDKSQQYYVGSSSDRAIRLANILGCVVSNLPFRYLGLPLYHKLLRKEDWYTVINRINMRIEGWKAKLLSQGGRLTIANSVLTSLPLLYLSIFKAPQWVLQRIEAPWKAFFQKGCTKITRKGGCLVNWKSIYKERKKESQESRSWA